MVLRVRCSQCMQFCPVNGAAKRGVMNEVIKSGGGCAPEGRWHSHERLLCIERNVLRGGGCR